jgi:4-aminobutyrate aminotransferase-like enzyme
MQDRLRELALKWPVIGDVRGLGLMIGVELVRDRESKEPAAELVLRLQNEAKRRGLIIGRGGLHANTIRICPPLIVTRGDVDTAIEILDASLETATLSA